MLGAIEAGGTKIICAIADENNVTEIIDEEIIETGDPTRNVEAIIQFFTAHPVQAIGVGSFGPIDVDRHSETYGYITNTPKSGWKNFDFLGALKKLAVPIYWTTDVNAAAFGEMAYGAARQTKNSVYLTVGTGVGGGVILNNEILPGKKHLEIGHISIARRSGDSFEGVCPYHDDCLEGLVSGPAIYKRTGIKGTEIGPEAAVWDTVAYYLAESCVNYALSFAPEVIVLGGGVMHQKQLFPFIRNYYLQVMNEYMPVADLESFIVHSELNNRAGIIGGLALAKKVLGGE
ncbi:ROK family protein [Enterococcus sp. AZ196]|uniref:ROK family protein n=1 Tax=Enterococcus sp. AZ196 TaxID=2774659 RepID=UPI003D279D7D